VHLSVQDDIEDHDPVVLNQVIDAVVVRQNAPDVARECIKPGLSGVCRRCVSPERMDPGQHLILRLLGANERGPLKVVDNPAHGGDCAVGDDDVPVHLRKIAMRGQNRG